MNKSLPLKLLALGTLALVLTSCLCSSTTTDPCKHASYDGKGMEPYVDSAHHFRLCVPKNLTHTGPEGTPDGQVVFSGFAVPPGTTLVSKTLVIVAGAYADMQGATPFGHFTADGVTFRRARLDEGSAGHSTLHVIYTWKTSGQPVHFDFTHRAVNPGDFSPGDQPVAYDQTAQIKLTEEIMGTFRRLPE